MPTNNPATQRIAERQYVVTMPDGSRWAVPLMAIATHRARYYAHEFGGDEARSLEEDTAQLFLEDDFNVADWARGNMNWSDVSTIARLIEEGETDYEDAWVNGDSEVVRLADLAN